MPTTRISDVVVPEVFGPYTQNYTTEKSELIRSGAVVYSESLSNKLSGGGLTFNEPSFRDLAQDEENISNDDPDVHSVPKKIGTLLEVQIRLSRNQSWSTMDLTSALAGADPGQAIANRVGNYWVGRQQKLFIATARGVFANDALPTDANHIQGEMTADASGTGSASAATRFSTEAFIDALTTMGDTQTGMGIVMVHSIVYARMQKNNLIDYIPDSEGRVSIAAFLGRRVIVDDSMPHDNGVFDTWIFGAGAFMFASGDNPIPVEVARTPSAGNGGGQEVLHNRVEWSMHPAGYAWVGDTASPGGPSNAATSGNIAAGTSWKRAFPERKQIKMARLKTREY